LKVVAIIDPAEKTATGVLKRKRNSSAALASSYADTRIASSLEDLINGMVEGERVDAFIVGSPPQYRGSSAPGRDVEMQILRAFAVRPPAIFVEKPISTDIVARAADVGRALYDSQTVVSVGYFLRYLKGRPDNPNSISILHCIAR
jgi:predicted dehydrogenase